MKRLLTLILCVFPMLCCFSQTSEFLLSKVPYTHFGVWVPKTFDDALKTDFTYAKDLASREAGGPHTILIVEPKRAWSTVKFHDGYGIPAADFSKYALGMADGQPTLVDDRGNSYVYLGPGNMSNYTDIFSAYLLAELDRRAKLVSPSIALKALSGNLYFLTQEPRLGPFKPLLDPFYIERLKFDTSAYNLFIYSDATKAIYGLKINPDSVIVDELVESDSFTGNALTEQSLNVSRRFTLK
jgi:hypothetical protein